MSEDVHVTGEVQPEYQLASRRFVSSGGLGKLAEALAKAQGEIEGAKKDANNPFFRSKYADLASVWEACRGPLSKNGLAVIQLPGSNGGGLFVDTILTHASGEWVSSRIYLKPGYTSKDGGFVSLEDPQAIGSAITYGRRYGLQAMVGIAPEDDDGNAASGAAEERQQAREQSDSGNRRSPVVATHIHFGKNKGTAIADLDARQLAWYARNEEEARTAGKKRSDADAALYEGVKAEIEKRKGSTPTPTAPSQSTDPDDKLPMFNGPKHEELASRLHFEGILPEDFMAAMKEAKQLPEHAKSFGAMTEETAAKFVTDMDGTIEVVRNWQARKGVPQ